MSAFRALSNLKTLGVASFMTASAVVGAPLTLSFEGMELAPYYDGVGIKSWCGGETEIGYKEKYTLEECNLLYNIRYGYYSMKTIDMYNETAKELVTPKIHASITDMSYNVGLGAVKNSGMIKNLNAGKPVEACNKILEYKKAGGRDCSLPENKKVCGGIWTRRKQVHKLCLEGIK